LLGGFAIALFGLDSVTAQAAPQDPAESLFVGTPEEVIRALDSVRAPQSEQLVHGIARRLIHHDRNVRAACVDALMRLRTDLAAQRLQLHKLVAADPAIERRNMNPAVGWMLSDAAIPVDDEAIERKLKAPDRDTVLEALRALARAGNGANPHLDSTLALAGHPDAHVREGVAHALGAMEDVGATCPALVQLLKDDSPAVRARAARSLGASAVSPELLRALRGALQDPESEVRVAVCEGLGSSGAEDTSVLRDLVTTLRDRSRPVRLAAIRALTALGGNADTARAIAPFVASTEARERNAALDYMLAAHQTAACAVPLLDPLLDDEDGVLRLKALQAAFRCTLPRDEGRLAIALIRGMADADSAVSEPATSMLQSWLMGAPRIAPRPTPHLRLR